MNDQDLMTIALQAVRDAVRLCEAVSEEMTQADHHQKEDKSPVTIADYGSQALILHALSRETPELGIVAEEQGEALRANPEMCERIARFTTSACPDVNADTLPDWLDHGAHQGGNSGRFWTLDPIDGTKGFLRGGQYAVALALIEDGYPVLGVLGCPRYDQLDGVTTRAIFYGGRGQEARVIPGQGGQERPVRVCANLASSDARLCESVESAHTAHDRSAKLIDVLGISSDVLRMDSQAKYAAVAHGAAGLYMRLPVKKGYREKIWDHAAGVAVIEAAGGKVTDLNGKALDFGLGETLGENRGVLATNGSLHHAALAAVKATTPPHAQWT